MSDIRVMFTIDDSQLSQVLQVMAPYSGGPAVVGLHSIEEPEGAGISARKARNLFVGRPHEPDTAEGNGNGKSPDGRPRGMMAAIGVLREAGNKGLAAGPFHEQMGELGFAKQASYQAVYIGKERGFIRKSANGRLFITKQGKAFE